MDEKTENMPKIRLQITVREDIVKWIDREVEKLHFATRSHAIEYALLQIMQEEQKKSQLIPP